MPAMAQQILTVTSAPVITIYDKHDPAIADIWRTNYQNMKHESSLHRRVLTDGSEKTERVSQKMEYRIGVIDFYVSANDKQ